MVASFAAASKNNVGRNSNWNVQQQQYIPLAQPHAGLLMNYSTALLQASLKEDASITFHPSQNFFGYYLRNHRHNLCGFPTGPEGTNYYTNAMSPEKKMLFGNQRYESKLRSVRVRVVVPKKKNYTRFLLVGSLCRLQDLMSPHLLKREMRIDLQLGKKLTRHEAGAAMRLAGKAGDNRDSVYFCDLPINMKTIELQHDDDEKGSQEEDSNFVLQGELDPRTWTLKGHMGNLSLQKKIEMLNTPITGTCFLQLLLLFLLSKIFIHCQILHTSIH